MQLTPLRGCHDPDCSGCPLCSEECAAMLANPALAFRNARAIPPGAVLRTGVRFVVDPDEPSQPTPSPLDGYTIALAKSKTDELDKPYPLRTAHVDPAIAELARPAVIQRVTRDLVTEYVRDNPRKYEIPEPYSLALNPPPPAPINPLDGYSLAIAKMKENKR